MDFRDFAWAVVGFLIGVSAALWVLILLSPAAVVVSGPAW
jgi:hypothetical protein